MHKIFFITIVITLTCVIVGMMISCGFVIATRYNQLPNEPLLVTKQKEQMRIFFQEHKESLLRIKNVLDNENLDIQSIHSDGLIVLQDGTSLHLQQIQEDIQNITNLENKTYESCVLDSVNADMGWEISLEVYFSVNQMTYTIVYSEKDLASSDERYEELDSNWFLWITGMT